MFRLVTSFIEKPAFLLLCDNVECAQVSNAEAVISELNPVGVPQQELAFLEEARRHGWMISMRLQLCPNHAKMLRDMAIGRRPAVVGPDGNPAGPQGGMAVTAE